MERAARIALFAAALAPFAFLVYGAVTGGLGPDPAERVMHVTGEWSMRLLVLTLLISPLRAWIGKPVVLRFRRMVGLLTFFYATVHLVSFLQFFTGWDGAALFEELVERPYVTMGFLGWLLMLPLAITSTRALQRRLGRNWAKLHRLIYPAAVAACVHLAWLSRSDIGEALVYAVVVGLLLFWRVRRRSRRSQSTGA